MRTILTTVGTSLIGNARRADESRPTDPDRLANFLRTEPPRDACAETNSLHRILREGDRIVFLCSDTDDGRDCARALQRHYERAEYITERVVIDDLNYAEGRFKMRGLRSLVLQLCELIRRERDADREVVVNATGGFKAEIAYATLVGVLFNAPVYYMHEKFDDVITMPAIPVGWDYGFLADHEEFFAWIADDYRETTEVDRRLNRLDEESRRRITVLLGDEEDGYRTLSPAGEAFYAAFRDRMDRASGTAVYLSSEARKYLDALDATGQREFALIFKQLRAKELRNAKAEATSRSDCLIYPRGHRNERVFFFDEDGAVYICALGRHSDQSYERLLERGVRREQYGGFEEWDGS